MTDEDRQARREEVDDRYAAIGRQIAADVRLEEARAGLLGEQAPTTHRSSTAPGPVELSGDSGVSPFEMYAEGFSYATIGKYMVAWDRRNRSS